MRTDGTRGVAATLIRALSLMGEGGRRGATELRRRLRAVAGARFSTGRPSPQPSPTGRGSKSRARFRGRRSALRRSKEGEQERPRLRGRGGVGQRSPRGAGRGKARAHGVPQRGWGSDTPYCTLSDYSVPVGVGPGGGAWAGVCRALGCVNSVRPMCPVFRAMCQLWRGDVSTLAGDLSSFPGDVFSFPSNVFTFPPNVFSFPSDVFSFRGHVFSFRRRAPWRFGRLRGEGVSRWVRTDREAERRVRGCPGCLVAGPYGRLGADSPRTGGGPTSARTAAGGASLPPASYSFGGSLHT